MKKENLKFLTVEQVMADYNKFAVDLKFKFTTDDNMERPIILFGGSYGGMLAAWLRMKFPNNFLGAVASSAPILQFKDAAPIELFYKIITDAYVDVDKDCSDFIN